MYDPHEAEQHNEGPGNLGVPLIPPDRTGKQLSALDETVRISRAELLMQVLGQLETLQSADAAARRNEIFGGE